jgi:hypothetical protein
MNWGWRPKQRPSFKSGGPVATRIQNSCSSSPSTLGALNGSLIWAYHITPPCPRPATSEVASDGTRTVPGASPTQDDDDDERRFNIDNYFFKF